MKTEKEYRALHYGWANTWTKIMLKLGVTQWKFIADSEGKIVHKKTRILNPYNPLSYIAVPVFVVTTLLVRAFEVLPEFIEDIKGSFKYN